jgi:hypothetical protein
VTTPSKGRRVTGWVLTGLATAFLLFDTALHVGREAHAVAAFDELGWPQHLLVTVGLIEAACLLLYLVPQTSVLGAVLLTGYFGGAIATNLRVEKPLLSTVLFPVYLALFVWGGLWLRSPRLQALFPLIRKPVPGDADLS